MPSARRDALPLAARYTSTAVIAAVLVILLKFAAADELLRVAVAASLKDAAAEIAPLFEAAFGRTIETPASQPAGPRLATTRPTSRSAPATQPEPRP